MTNERAIELLNRIQDEQFDGVHGDERRGALEMAVRALSGEGDTISRQAAIDEVVNWLKDRMTDGKNGKPLTDRIKDLPSAQPEQRWIPFNTRSLTEEEKEDHPEWDCILDCKLPDDGQAILVSINIRGHERVQYDEFFTDDGSYLDSGYEIDTEATAWMPLPKPYRGESDV